VQEAKDGDLGLVVGVIGLEELSVELRSRARTDEVEAASTAWRWKLTPRMIAKASSSRWQKLKQSCWNLQRASVCSARRAGRG
jgi:hypothetical protein